jgi:hypothetical protein
MSPSPMLATLDLDGLVRLVERRNRGRGLFVRWSHGPEEDLSQPGPQSSRDALTGVSMPGLSASPLRIERWWGDRSPELWVARRVCDYRHLPKARDPSVRPWVLIGDQRGRGPDNEPLVVCRRAVAWISDDAVKASEELIARSRGGDGWGPINREPDS